MTTALNPENLIGTTALDASGNKLGSVGQVYLDDRSGQPTWVTVSTGLFGARQSFAPLYRAHLSGDEVVLTVTKDQVKDAPNIDDDGHLDHDEARALYDHYAAIFSTDSGWRNWQSGGYAPPPTAEGEPAPAAGPGNGESGRETDEAMTRSEERLHVGTEQVATGRARLRKYVVTENVTQTVPVSHEEVRVEREPITDANAGAATEGPVISEAEHEVTVHAERPVVGKETVPVERVRMDTETVIDEQTVDESVRKEQIEIEADEGTAKPSRKRGRR